MMPITMTHIRQANLCSSGTRAWFEKQGFSWPDFLKNGISIEKFEATGDALALRVVKIAKEESAK